MRVVGCAVLLATVAGRAYAGGGVDLTLNQLGMDIATQIGTSVPQLAADAQQKISALFELSGLPQLLRSFADTGQFAARGLGVSYQTDPGDRIVGVAVGGAIASNAALSSDKPLSATVLDYAIYGGVNLAQWNHPRWTIFANGSYAASTIRGLAGSLVTVGAHAQYQLVAATAPGAARWTGVAITSGFEFARWSISLASTLETHVVVKGSADQASIHLSCAGTLAVLAQTGTVPLEVSTGVRFGELLGIYAGAGVAATTGSSTIDAVLDATMSVNASRMTIGNAHITASESSSPSTWSADAFGGIELRSRYVRGYAQGAIAPDERGVAIGLRAVF